MALKQDVMYLYFVDESNKAYYQSPMFGKLLQYLQLNTSRCRLRNRNGRNSISVDHVSSVEEAQHVLQQVLELKGI